MTHDDGQRRVVLLTGVYGTGKSSVAEEIAEVLEKRSVAYAALDLDWLAWVHAPAHESHSDQRMLLANLRGRRQLPRRRGPPVRSRLLGPQQDGP